MRREEKGRMSAVVCDVESCGRTFVEDDEVGFGSGVLFGCGHGVNLDILGFFRLMVLSLVEAFT